MNAFFVILWRGVNIKMPDVIREEMRINRKKQVGATMSEKEGAKDWQQMISFGSKCSTDERLCGCDRPRKIKLSPLPNSEITLVADRVLFEEELPYCRT